MKKVEALNKYDKVKLSEIRYGLEGFYLTLTKLIIMAVLAFMFNIEKQTFLLFLLYLPIRTFSFGFHANTSFQCLVMSLISFLLLPLLANYFTLKTISKIIIYSILIIAYFIMAPKDTHKKPIRNKKKRFYLKIVSVIIVSLYLIISLTIKNNLIINLMLLALLLQLIMISPIPFIIFKQKYNFKWFK